MMKNVKLIKNVDKMLAEESQGHVYSEVISHVEKMLIEKALQRAFGNQSIAAKLLGINRNTMRMKIKKMDIDVTKFKI